MLTSIQRQDQPGRARHPLWCALAINLVLFLAVYALWAPRFGTNDDVTMMLQSAGVSQYVAPTASLLWSSAVFGSMLKALYAWQAGVPWYAVSLVMGLFVAHTAVLTAAMGLRPSWPRVALYLLYFLTEGVYLLLNLHYTSLAELMVLSGFLLLLADPADEERGEEKSRRRPAWREAWACAFIALGSMVRWDTFALPLALGVPVLLAGSVCPWRTRLVRRGIVVALGILGGVVLQQADTRLRRGDESWKEFCEYYPLVRRFVDYKLLAGRPAGELEAIVGKAGWTLNDYELISNFWFLDPALYSAERLRAVLAGVPAMKAVPVAKAAVGMKRILADYVSIHGLLVALLGVYVLHRRRGSALLFGLATGLVLGLLAYLIYFRKPPPPRVFAPMFAFLAALPLVLPSAHAKAASGGRSKTRIVLAVILACGVLLIVRRAVASCRWQSMENRSQQAELRGVMKHLAPAPSHLYVLWGASFPWPHLAPFEDLRWLRSFKTFGIGGAQRLRDAQRILAEFGIGDLPSALAGDRHVLLVCDPDTRFPLYRTYMREHRGIDVEAEVVQRNAEFTVLQVTHRSPAR